MGGINLFKSGKRKCYRCKDIYPLNADNFFRNRTKATGFGYHCKSCNYNGGFRRPFIKQKGFTCSKCKLCKPGFYGFFDVDHIVPLKRGRNKTGQGAYLKKIEEKNLQVLCPNCHREKTLLDLKRPLK